MSLVTTMTRTLMDSFGVKERTARGYAVVIAALRYLYDRNEEYFLNRSHPWTEFMEVFSIIKFSTSSPCLYFRSFFQDSGPRLSDMLTLSLQMLM